MLSERLDLKVDLTGKSWSLPEPWEGLKFKPADACATLMRMALAPVKHGGAGYSREELREELVKAAGEPRGFAPMTGTEYITYTRVFPELRRKLS